MSAESGMRIPSTAKVFSAANVMRVSCRNNFGSYSPSKGAA
jgi:hypothetical protein